MQILPAIDILAGRVVRLKQGRLDAVTVYNTDPVDQALRWAEAGAEWIHVVDLDGAVTGQMANIASVEEIVRAVDVPVQVGGGIRSITTLRRLYDAGVSRTVLGTTLVTRPDLVAEACAEFPGIVAGVDARDGLVAIQGWGKGTDREVVELVLELQRLGVLRVVYTDIALDGMQTGVNADAYRTLTAQVDIAVIASGGVTSLDDIRGLAQVPGVEGVIVGRALYESSFTLEEAIAGGREAGADPC
jgi:phosphoribosylformimino-5-aminoimidazole carboxamide ribotide isomerase